MQFLMRTTEMCVNGVISDPFVLLWRMNARKMHKYSPFIFIMKIAVYNDTWHCVPDRTPAPR